MKTDSGRDFRSIGDRLRQLRLFRDALQKDMAAVAGVTPQAWNNWEKGRARPDVEQVYALCRATGVTSDWVYYGDRSGLPLRLVEWLVMRRDEGQASGA